MTVIQDLRQRLQARIPRFRGTSRRTVAGAAVVAAISGLLLTSTPAIAQPKPVGEYIEIDFTAAAPKSYSHLVGGGAYDTGKSNVDTVQQLEGKDFVCGDIVSFMTKIKMNDGEAAGYGATTLRLRYSWDMAATGSSTGVAFADLIHAQINYGTIDDLLEPTSTIDDAIIDDGNSTATIHSEVATGPIWVSGSKLITEIDVTDVEASETVVLQLDVKIKCDPSQTSSGNIQAQLQQVDVIEVATNPTGITLPDIVNSGIRTVPMKAGSIRYPQVSIQKTVTTPTGNCATASDSILIESGDAVKWCFAVLNPSSVLVPPGAPLYQLRIVDDNGTPADSSDDWWIDTSTLTGLQNLDGLGQLNDLGPGVTVYASVVETITGEPGATIFNTATAYGDDSVIDPYTLSDSDNARALISAAAPSVAIAKTTSNTIDVAPSDSPIIYKGDVANWYYEVTNTGNVPLTSVTVTDNQGVVVTCPSTTLAPGAVMMCRGDGIAIAGTYTNIGTVVASYNGDTVTASDPSGYFGLDPEIEISKTPATQTVIAGETATFTLVITNTGNVTLSSVSVSDSLTPSCAGPLAALGVGESVTVTCAAGSVMSPFTNTAVATGTYGTRTVSDTATAAVLVDYLPDIAVTKTANPTSVPETGGSVTFTVVVTSSGVDPFTLNTLTDSVYGNLDGKGSCDVPQTIAAGGQYTCTFTETVTGEPATPHVDIVTASGVDPEGNPDTATDDAIVALTDVLPNISVTKTADPTSVSELGGAVAFTVVVNNVNAEAVTLTSLSDNVFGNLNGKGTCATGGSIAGGGSYSCTFTETLAGQPASPHVDTVTAVASDNDGNNDTATDDATVAFNDVLPNITVTKTANPTSVSELGGAVEFAVAVTNVNAEPVTLTSLTDNVFGDLNGKGTCAVGGSIAGGGSFTCSFTETLTGEPAAPHVDTVTAVAADNDGNSDTASAQASVTFIDVLPDITVTKSANPTSVSELGGAVAFTVVVSNVNGEPVTLTTLTDNVFGNLNGKGTCATGGSIAGSGSYTCTFTETLTGQPASPHVDTVTAVASDNDGNSDTATDDAVVSFTDVLPDITVTKTANPTSVSELGGAVTFSVVVSNVNAEALTLNSLTDNVFGDLNGKGTCATGASISGGGSYTCSFTETLSGQPASPHVDTVTAVASDNDGNRDTATASATVAFNNVLPNITVVKTANPTTLPISGGYVDYLIRVTNSGPETVTITSLVDPQLTLPETCTAAVVGQTLSPGIWVDCVISQQWITPGAGGTFTNTATSIGCDDDGSCDTDTGTATVVFSWYGRTPGYWKNHPAAWPSPYVPSQLLSTVFTLPANVTSGTAKPQAGDTLMMSLNYQGGSALKGAAQILLRAATAAVLNEQYYGDWYPATSVTSLRTSVNNALASGNRSTILTLATQLDSWNNGIERSMP